MQYIYICIYIYIYIYKQRLAMRSCALLCAGPALRSPALYTYLHLSVYAASLALSTKVLVKVLRDAYGLQDRSRHKASSEATAHPESAAGTRPLFGGNGPSGIFSSRR